MVQWCSSVHWNPCCCSLLCKLKHFALSELTHQISSRCFTQVLTKIRHALDTDDILPDGVGAHDMAAMLLAFFIDLPVPLIPESMEQVAAEMT